MQYIISVHLTGRYLRFMKVLFSSRYISVGTPYIGKTSPHTLLQNKQFHSIMGTLNYLVYKIDAPNYITEFPTYITGFNKFL